MITARETPTASVQCLYVRGMAAWGGGNMQGVCNLGGSCLPNRGQKPDCNGLDRETRQENEV